MIAGASKPVVEYQSLIRELAKEKGYRWLADRIGTGTSNVGMLMREGAKTSPSLYGRIVDFFDRRTKGLPTPPMRHNKGRGENSGGPAPASKPKKVYSRIPPVHLGRLRALAEKHGQQWLTERTGISRSGISQVLKGGAGVRPVTLAAVIELVGKEGAEAKSSGFQSNRPLAPLGIKRSKAATGETSEALALMLKLSDKDRRRVLDAIAIIEGKS